MGEATVLIAAVIITSLFGYIIYLNYERRKRDLAISEARIKTQQEFSEYTQQIAEKLAILEKKKKEYLDAKAKLGNGDGNSNG